MKYNKGGRIDESMFVVDGFSVKDPLSGYSGNLFVNADAIEELEIVTGGYSAEYGQAMSGIINIKLKEGRDRYEGALKFSSDRLLKDNFNSDRIEFNLGGPDMFLKKYQIFGEGLTGSFSFFLMDTEKFMTVIFLLHLLTSSSILECSFSI